MATTQQYLEELITQKNNLVSNLVSKGVDASNDETFTTLVPKINDIPSGGGDVFTPYYINFQAYKGSYIGNLSPIDTSNITNMNNMFYECNALESLDLSSFNTKNVTSMNNMFNECRALKSLDLSSFNTENVTNMGNMFDYCRTLQSLDISNFDMSKVIANNSMLNNMTNLTNLIFGTNLGKGYTTKTTNFNSYLLSVSYNTSLTHESLMDIINKLYDLNLTYDVANGGTLYTQRLYLGSTNMAKLTAEEIEVATSKGWTVA